MSPVLVQRLEGAALALAVVMLFSMAGFQWWWLLVFFLAFDFSALGYLGGPKLGALSYNLVHNYAVPATLLVVYSALWLASLELRWLAFLAGCWAFHVAVDRALGYGLKSSTGFEHTHLGLIGKARNKTVSN